MYQTMTAAHMGNLITSLGDAQGMQVAMAPLVSDNSGIIQQQQVQQQQQQPQQQQINTINAPIKQQSAVPDATQAVEVISVDQQQVNTG